MTPLRDRRLPQGFGNIGQTGREEQEIESDVQPYAGEDEHPHRIRSVGEPWNTATQQSVEDAKIFVKNRFEQQNGAGHRNRHGEQQHDLHDLRRFACIVAGERQKERHDKIYRNEQRGEGECVAPAVTKAVRCEQNPVIVESDEPQQLPVLGNVVQTVKNGEKKGL